MNPRISERLATLLLGMLLALMTFAAYFPALHGGFIWDDDRYVSDNPLMIEPGGLARIWLRKDTEKHTDQYYPLVYSSFWAERRLWGLNPTGYHVVNVTLHIINALLVWLLLRRVGIKNAWIAAAIFALHPVHVESVAWISERKNVLSGVFYLLALVSYLNFDETDDRRFYFGALALFFLALFSKTVTCTLPAIILVLMWMQGRRVGIRDIVRLVPFFVIGAGAGLLTSRIEHGYVFGHYWDLSPWQRLLLAGRSAAFYAEKLAWPSSLSFNYTRWKLDPRDIIQWSWDILWLGCFGLLYRLRRTIGRGPLAGLLFFILTLVPALGFFRIYPQRFSYVADHFQYLASLGLIAVFVGTMERRVPAVAMAVLLPVLGLLTWRQAHAYENVDVLWRDTISKNPDSVLAHSNLGHDLYVHGQLDEAIAQYRAAIAIDPEMTDANLNLGLALASQGKLGEAQARFAVVMAQYQQALKDNPRFIDTYVNIGDLFLIEGRNSEAAASYARVLWVNPNLPAPVYARAGYAYAASGDYMQAIRHYREAIRIGPDLAEAHIRLGDALAAIGHNAEALSEYQTAIRLAPSNNVARARAAIVRKLAGSR